MNSEEKRKKLAELERIINRALELIAEAGFTEEELRKKRNEQDINSRGVQQHLASIDSARNVINQLDSS